MFKYRNAEKSDYHELVDLMNYVFKVDFEMVLPKTFNQEFEFEKITKIAENEQGKLVAAVCVLPQQINVGEEKLCTNFLGGVTVHPRYRGQSHMITLMDMWLGEMKDQCDMSVLTGLRQRYEHFGYTAGGVQWEYLINRHNINHTLKNISNANINIRPLGECDGGFEFAAKLNNSKTVNLHRGINDASNIMVCYRQHPFAVLEGENLIGYIITNADRDEISEFVLVDFKDTKKVLKSYFDFFKTEKVKMIVPDHETYLNRELCDFADDYKTGPCCNFNIFNFAKVIKTYLSLKNQTHKLNYGRFSAVMDGQPITVTVDENGVSVEKTASADAVVLDKMEAQKLLLTHFGRYMDVKVPNDWFPLPIFWNKVDRF